MCLVKLMEKFGICGDYRHKFLKVISMLYHYFNDGDLPEVVCSTNTYLVNCNLAGITKGDAENILFTLILLDFIQPHIYGEKEMFVLTDNFYNYVELPEQYHEEECA